MVETLIVKKSLIKKTCNPLRPIIQTLSSNDLLNFIGNFHFSFSFSEDREYMSFGLSGDDSKSVMIGGDVVVAWVDKETLKGYAEDYYLKDKSQCSGPTGSCPDNRLQVGRNDFFFLSNFLENVVMDGKVSMYDCLFD